MGLPMGKQERSLKFVKELWPNLTINPLKEGGGLKLLSKEAVIYNFPLSCIWEREKGCMVFSLFLDFSNEKQLQRKS